MSYSNDMIEDDYEDDEVPATQDIQNSSQEGATQQPIAEPIWGSLNPILPDKLIPYSLSKVEYKFGRKPISMDIVFSTDNMYDDYLILISKHQFTLTKTEIYNTPVVFLEDFSRNGTFVNFRHVGNGNKVILDCDDLIAFSKPHRNVYKFQTSIYENFPLPPELKIKYIVAKELGSGASARVKLILCKFTHKAYALKIIHKKKSEVCNADILKEVNILKELQHPFIIEMIDIFDESDDFYIILELMQGGELLERIRGTNGLNDDVAKFIFYQIAKAVEYLHNKGIAHRDLKPENILLNSKSMYPLVKISDFGLSKLTDSQTILKTFCGTLLYAAPELLKNNKMSYTNQVDIWSLGLVLYTILTGCHPFSTKDTKIILRDKILSGKIDYSNVQFKHVSLDAIDLLKNMLIVDPNKRLTIHQVVQSRWLNDSKLKLRIRKLISETFYGHDGYSSNEPSSKRPCL